METLDRIEQWRATLTEGQRVAWNAPSTVWRVAHCKTRGMKAVLEKTEAPIPNPSDLARPADEFAEENEQLAWQRGLFERLMKTIDNLTLHGRWLLPEPPDRGLLATADEVINAAIRLRDDLQKAREVMFEENNAEESPSEQAVLAEAA